MLSKKHLEEIAKKQNEEIDTLNCKLVDFLALGLQIFPANPDEVRVMIGVGTEENSLKHYVSVPPEHALKIAYDIIAAVKSIDQIQVLVNER